MYVMLAFFCLTLGVNSISILPRPCIGESRARNIEGLERYVYSVAREKGVAATVIVNRLQRKIRQRMDKLRDSNTLQDLALQELLKSVGKIPSVQGQPAVVDVPPLPPSSSFDQRPISTSFRFANRPPNPQFQQPPPSMFNLYPTVPQSPPLFIPVESFRPPPGVTVRINAGSFETALPDVTVTISPLMTVVEALRQANLKFRSVLGYSSDSDDVITFSHAPYAGCYIVSRFENVLSTEKFAWKIIVSDINGKVVYDSICLPSRKEVPVKPGTTISLSYTELEELE